MTANFSNLKLLETEALWKVRLDWNTIALFYRKEWFDFCADNFEYLGIWLCHIVNIFFKILRESFIYSRSWNTNQKLFLSSMKQVCHLQIREAKLGNVTVLIAPGILAVLNVRWQVPWALL